MKIGQNHDAGHGRADRHFLVISLLVLLGLVPNGRAEDWQSTLTKGPPGDFSPLRSLRAKYSFGWGGFTAATGDVHFLKSNDGRLRLDGSGGTTGFPRLLFKLDAIYSSSVDADSFRPVEVKQSESYRSSKIVTHLTFRGSGVKSERVDGPKSEVLDFSFPHLFDLLSAALYFRSQSLKDRDTYRIAVYPAKNAYVATISVIGREKIAVRAGRFNTIKLDLKVQRIGKDLQLEPYRKLRRATLWLSDDSDRILLRGEAQIFVGTIFTELQSVHYESAKAN